MAAINPALSSYCDFRYHNQRPFPPEGRSWLEDEIFLGNRVKALVIIIKTRGCSWQRSEEGGCSMCGYAGDTRGPRNDPIAQIEHHLSRYQDKTDEIPVVKLFTSGSFFDTEEIEDPMAILDILMSHGFGEILVESRPDLINVEGLEKAKEMTGDKLTLALGLETVSDFVRVNAVNKGLKTSQFDEAIGMIKNMGLGAKAYLLLKPPFLNEEEAMEDCLNSVDWCAERVDNISINPVNVQKGTLVDRLYRRRSYTPPWLWSLLSVAVRGVEKHRALIEEGKLRICSSPTGLGMPRGVHNCGRCDREAARVLNTLALDLYSSPSGFDSILEKAKSFMKNGCSCQDEWRRYLKAGQLCRYIG